MMPETSDIWLQDFKTKFQGFVDSKARANRTPVKIAILDTGFDGKLEEFHQQGVRIKAYKSWVTTVDTPIQAKSPSGLQRRFMRDNCKDEVGHGTHLTALILQTNPWADLYVARVTDQRFPEEKSVAEAIQYAVTDWDVDIISLSLGFEKNGAALEEAIDAVHAKVLVFAAASNRGGSCIHPVYPARDGRVICVHAAHSNGMPYKDNPPPKDGNNLMTLGYDVPSLWPRELLASGERAFRDSGTSVATAILASTAALLLEVLRQEADDPHAAWAAEHLKKQAAMKLVLRDMLSLRVDKFCYVEPFLHLDGTQEDSTSVDYSRRNRFKAQVFNKLLEFYAYSEAARVARQAGMTGNLLSSGDEALRWKRIQEEALSLARFLDYGFKKLLGILLSPTKDFVSRIHTKQQSSARGLLQDDPRSAGYWGYLTAAGLGLYKDLYDYIQEKDWIDQMEILQTALYREGIVPMNVDTPGHEATRRPFNLNQVQLLLYMVHVALRYPTVRPLLPLDADRLHRNARFGNWVPCRCSFQGRSCPNRWNFANGKQGLTCVESGSVALKCKAIIWWEQRGEGADLWKANRKAWMETEPDPTPTG